MASETVLTPQPADRGPWAHADRYGWPLCILKCGDCGLIYSRECWTHDGARRFYRDHYRPLVNAYHGKSEGYDWRAESQAHARAVHLKLSAADVPSGAGLRLDVGSMDEDSGTGPESDGVLWEEQDVYPHALITCIQTFDHLIDPRLAWDKFARAGRPGGHLYVDVVDPHAVLQRGGNPWKADHSLYVTPRVLRAMGSDRAIWDEVAHGYLPDGVHYYGLWRRR